MAKNSLFGNVIEEKSRNEEEHRSTVDATSDFFDRRKNHNHISDVNGLIIIITSSAASFRISSLAIFLDAILRLSAALEMMKIFVFRFFLLINNTSKFAVRQYSLKVSSRFRTISVQSSHIHSTLPQLLTLHSSNRYTCRTT